VWKADIDKRKVQLEKSKEDDFERDAYIWMELNKKIIK
jgi:hypothetical protein